MAIKYESLTQDEMDEMLADEIHGLEVQHFQFKQQEERQAKILAGLPTGDWPGEIKYLKGKKRDDIAKSAMSSVHMQLAQKYDQRDFISLNQKVASTERIRSEDYQKKALESLPVERRSKAISAARVKREAEKNARLGITKNA